MRCDDANWKLGVIYNCSGDPRFVVRNRTRFGWTWNFAHRYVALIIPCYVVAFFAPLLLYYPPVEAHPVIVIAVCIAVFIGLVYVSHRVAEGP